MEKNINKYIIIQEIDKFKVSLIEKSHNEKTLLQIFTDTSNQIIDLYVNELDNSMFISMISHTFDKLVDYLKTDLQSSLTRSLYYNHEEVIDLYIKYNTLAISFFFIEMNNANLLAFNLPQLPHLSPVTKDLSPKTRDKDPSPNKKE